MIKRIVFFGGAFDPPHTEHIEIARRAAEDFSPDMLIIMPTYLSPHKNSFFAADAKDRLEMCRIAFGGIKNAVVSDMEISRGGKSYSHITMKQLSEEYPSAEILFLMGTDMIETFGDWKEPDEILRYSRPLLCCRAGEGKLAEQSAKDFHDKFGVKVEILGYEGKDLSSTQVKTEYMCGLSVQDKISPETLKYIENNGIYQSPYFDFIKKNLKPSRLVHTAGVVIESVRLAKRTGVDLNKAVVAATLHDCAKYLNKEDFKDFRVDDDVPPQVVHQYLGAFVAEKVLGVKDEEILGAIRFHTTGTPDMTTLGKVIFVADMIERGRVYDEAEELRRAVDEDFERGFVLCLKMSAEFVKTKKSVLYRKTAEALEYYEKEII